MQSPKRQEKAIKILGDSNQETIRKVFQSKTNEQAMLAIIWTGVKILLTRTAITEHDYEFAEFQNECFERLK